VNWFFALIFVVVAILSLNQFIQFFVISESLRDVMLVGTIFVLLAILIKELI